MPPRGKRRERRYRDWIQEGFPLYLQQQLQLREWNLSDLSEQSGIAVSVISRWMQGQQPSANSIRSVARAFSLPYEEVWQAALNERVSTEDPQRLELTRLLERVDLTKERYTTLRTLMMVMIEDSPPVNAN